MILVVKSNFYPHISDLLTLGAVDYLKSQNYLFEIVEIPGVFEIPAAISFAIEAGRYEGYVALGCVIRGETTHYDYVCIESARGINNIAIKERVAIGNGILTTENEEQAIKRADPKHKNKGAFAAKACIDMIKLKKFLAIK